MASSIKLLIKPKLAENTNTVQYVIKDGSRIVIDSFTATNTSGGVVTMNVNLIISGVIIPPDTTKTYTADNTNLIVKAVSIEASETYTFPELIGAVVESGGAISTLASSASALTITASGREIV
jgi:hypothetical protein